MIAGVVRKQRQLVMIVTIIATLSSPPARAVQTAAEASVHGAAKTSTIEAPMSSVISIASGHSISGAINVLMAAAVNGAVGFTIRERN